MKIISSHDIEMKDFGVDTSCKVKCIHVEVGDVKSSAEDLIRVLEDRSWISDLGAVEQVAFSARAEKTIKKLVDDILTKVEDSVTVEFGEFLISTSAQNALELDNHIKVPLAELFKEKLIGNMGFDFHTQSSDEYLMFGEAKYSGSANPYSNATSQILDMVSDKKDESELSDLQHFVSELSIERALKNEKGYVAAFSMNSSNPNLIFKNVLESDEVSKLIKHEKLYIIGIST